jgi:uncharacterized MAPEG superfamily protein
MEPAMLAASHLVTVVAWSVVLLVIHIMLQGMTATRELGSAWNAGPRDDGQKPKGALAGRADRALNNFKETYPAFVGLALGLAIVGDPSGWGLIGAWVWLVFRVVYIPLYLAGIPYIRSLIWVGSLVGLLIMFFTLVF